MYIHCIYSSIYHITKLSYHLFVCSCFIWETKGISPNRGRVGCSCNKKKHKMSENREKGGSVSDILCVFFILKQTNPAIRPLVRLH